MVDQVCTCGGEDDPLCAFCEDGTAQDAFGIAFAKMAAIFRTPIDPACASGYWGELKTFHQPYVLEAIKRAQGSFEAFPSPVELKRGVRSVWREHQAKEALSRVTTSSSQFKRFAFLLAQLADPEVPEEKKNQIKEEWQRRHGGEMPPPWEATYDQFQRSGGAGYGGGSRGAQRSADRHGQERAPVSANGGLRIFRGEEQSPIEWDRRR